MEIVNQDGTPLVWKAHFWRYHCEEWEEFDSPEEAVGFLQYGEDDGRLSAAGVVFPDGTERAYDYAHNRLLDPGVTA